jgi:hypothetical protein
MSKEEGRTSFLKKRSKKFLVIWAGGVIGQTPLRQIGRSLFASRTASLFFRKRSPF